MTNKEKLEKLKKLADAMYYAAQHLTTDASRLHKAMEEYHQFIMNEYHKEEPTIPDIVDEHFYEMLGEEPVNNDFEMALAEMIDKSRTSVIESLVIAAQWKDELIKLAKSEVSVSEEWVKELRAKLDSLSKEDFKKVFDKYAVDFNEEPVSEDLEEEIKRYLHKVYDRDTTVGDVARHFAKWQKQQMLAKAVDGTFSTGELSDGTPIDAIFNFDKVVGNKYEEGEKVKVIVIKEIEL